MHKVTNLNKNQDQIQQPAFLSFSFFSLISSSLSWGKVAKDQKEVGGNGMPRL
jgi:hypothetical protein